MEERSRFIKTRNDLNSNAFWVVDKERFKISCQISLLGKKNTFWWTLAHISLREISIIIWNKSSSIKDKVNLMCFFSILQLSIFFETMLRMNTLTRMKCVTNSDIQIHPGCLKIMRHDLISLTIQDLYSLQIPSSLVIILIKNLELSVLKTHKS